MDKSVAQWVITTVTSYCLLAVWVAANLTTPLIHLDPNLSTGLLVAGLAGLGIQFSAGYKAVGAGQEQAKFEGAPKFTNKSKDK